MEAVTLIWRSRLRLRWRAWLALVVLLGLGAGAGLACLAGARRTASSFGRIAAATNEPDINSSHGLPPAEAEEIAGRFTGVADHETVVGFVGYAQDVDPTLFKYFLGSWKHGFRSGTPLLQAGRLPRLDRPEEVLVTSPRAEAAGIVPGRTLTLELLDINGGPPETASVVVTGIAAFALEAAADSAYDRGAMLLTPAFTRAHLHLQAWSATNLTAEPGVDVDAEIVPQLLERGWSTDELHSTTRSRVQDALRPLTATLGLLGGLVLAATLVVTGQALARQRDAVRDDMAAVRAMGLTANQTRALDALTVLTVVVPGAVLAVATAVALSPLFPVGSVRRLEPDRGVAVDATVLALGALALVGVLLAAGRIGSRGPSRSASAPAALRLGPLNVLGTAAEAGVRLAMGATTHDRRRFRTTVAVTAAALALVVGGLAFVGALDRLANRPSRYGVGWDLTARNAYGEVDPEAVRALVAGDTDIRGVAGADLTIVVLNGEVSSPALATLPITTELWPTVVEGRAQNDDEILVGREILDRLDAKVGDKVDIRLAYGRGGELPPVRTVTIAGTAVFPSIELAGVDPTRLGTGVGLTYPLYQSIVAADDAQFTLPDLVFFDLAEGVDPQAVISRYAEGMPETSGFSVTDWLPSLAPAEVRETEEATGLIWAVIVFLVLTVVATVANGLAATVRRRRGDYAILKALGLRRGQVRATVAWQAVAAVALALAIGLPLGVAAGRWAWRLFARFIGVIDTPVIPVVPVIAVAVGALVAAALVALGPGLRAGRVPPVTLHPE